MSELSRLRWRCRRGMRELDEAMLAYLDNHYQQADAMEQARFAELLDWQDPALYRLLCGKDRDDRFQTIIDKITSSFQIGNRC